MLFANEDDWLLKAGELEPGGKLRIVNLRWAQGHKDRLAEMQAAIDAQYPGRRLAAYWHGGFSVYRDRG